MRCATTASAFTDTCTAHTLASLVTTVLLPLLVSQHHHHTAVTATASIRATATISIVFSTFLRSIVSVLSLP
jgi:MFS-type transporter involved in bile tolerance (Atg22 family)